MYHNILTIQHNFQISCSNIFIDFNDFLEPIHEYGYPSMSSNHPYWQPIVMRTCFKISSQQFDMYAETTWKLFMLWHLLGVMTTCWQFFYSGTLLLCSQILRDFLLVPAEGSQKVLNLKPIVCFLKFSLHFSSLDKWNLSHFYGYNIRFWIIKSLIESFYIMRLSSRSHIRKHAFMLTVMLR